LAASLCRLYEEVFFSVSNSYALASTLGTNATDTGGPNARHHSD
jgi:hypothetical protein